MPPSPAFRYAAKIVLFLGTLAVAMAAPAVFIQGDWEYGLLLMSVIAMLPLWARLSRG